MLGYSSLANPGLSQGNPSYFWVDKSSSKLTIKSHKNQTKPNLL